jgi:hypothetical protein
MIRFTRLLSVLILLFGLSAALAVERTMNFNSTNPPANSEYQLANPWIEDGMRLVCLQPTSAQNSDVVIRTTSQHNTGLKSPGAKWSMARFYFHRPDYGPFAMKSIRLFPFGGGGASTVTFTGIKHAGGPAVTTTLSTGTSLTGVTHQFPANFNGLSEVRWTVDNNNAGFGYHQFDDLTAEFPPLITVPPSMTISEGSGANTIALSREAGVSGTITITPTVGGTASHPSDFSSSLIPSASVQFTDSVSEATFTIQALADSLNESPETVVITWTASPDYVLSNPTTTLTIGDINGSGFSDYVSGHGLTGNDALPDSDPNGDGISNLSAYLHRLNPAGPSPAAWLERLPKFTSVSVGPTVYPAITWLVPQPWPADVRCMVRESAALASWSEIARRDGYGLGSQWNGAMASSVQDGGSPVRTVIVRSGQSIGSRPAAFHQLVLEWVVGGGGLD